MAQVPGRCLNCGGSLAGKRKDAKYCSLKCANDFNYARSGRALADADREARRVRRSALVCRQCGERFAA
jgi:hypothetical protein